MERNGELKFKLDEETVKKYEIGEEEVFDAYYKDGYLYVPLVTGVRVDSETEESDEEYIDCTERECEACEYHCPHCGACILDDEEEESEDYYDEND